MPKTSPAGEPATDLVPLVPPANGAGPYALPARRRPSDDFAVVVNGETFHPRAGQHLLLGADRTLREDNALQAAKAQRAGEDEAAFWDRLWRHMTEGKFLLGWDWTDRAGAPLPQPFETGAYEYLTPDENIYVVRTVLYDWREPDPNA